MKKEISERNKNKEGGRQTIRIFINKRKNKSVKKMRKWTFNNKTIKFVKMSFEC